jgi:hypothetical protein
MTGPRRSLTTILLFLCLAAACSGCATLSTWERSILMSRVMLDPGNPMAHQLEDHVHAVREAAAGASTGGGAACGCN